jgi:site-specific DNA recombinase
LTLIEECVEVETAKCVGRLGFIAMVGFFKKHGHVTPREGNRTVLLGEKTDRLYRDLKDWVTLDELDLEIHFVKKDVVLTRDSGSSEKFMHGIKVLKGRYIYYHCMGFQGE